jgi:uncharacterized protein (DUF2236 family)
MVPRVQNDSMERPSPGGMTWTIAGERVARAGLAAGDPAPARASAGRAGVAQHSGFRSSPLAPFARLHATVSAMRQLTFGTTTGGGVVRRIIGRPRSRERTLGEAPVRTRAPRYSAHDPALLLWVHATLLDSHVRILEQILRPFSPDELDATAARRCPSRRCSAPTAADVPSTWRQLQDLIAATDRERARDRRRRRPRPRPRDPAAGTGLARLAAPGRR